VEEIARVVILPGGGEKVIERESFYGSSKKHPCYRYFSCTKPDGSWAWEVDLKDYKLNKFGRVEDIKIVYTLTSK